MKQRRAKVKYYEDKYGKDWNQTTIQGITSYKDVVAEHKDTKELQEIPVTELYFNQYLKKVKETHPEVTDYEILNRIAMDQVIDTHLGLDEYSFKEFNEMSVYAEDEYDDLKIFFLELLGANYPAYIIYAEGMSWNGASGYHLTEEYLDTSEATFVAMRKLLDLEGSLYFQDFLNRGKVTHFRHSDHDWPTGKNLYLIGLTEAEYKKYNNLKYHGVDAVLQELDKLLGK